MRGVLKIRDNKIMLFARGEMPPATRTNSGDGLKGNKRRAIEHENLRRNVKVAVGSNVDVICNGEEVRWLINRVIIIIAVVVVIIVVVD